MTLHIFHSQYFPTISRATVQLKIIHGYLVVGSAVHGYHRYVCINHSQCLQFVFEWINKKKNLQKKIASSFKESREWNKKIFYWGFFLSCGCFHLFILLNTVISVYEIVKVNGEQQKIWKRDGRRRRRRKKCSETTKQFIGNWFLCGIQNRMVNSMNMEYKIQFVKFFSSLNSVLGKLGLQKKCSSECVFFLHSFCISRFSNPMNWIGWLIRIRMYTFSLLSHSHHRFHSQQNHIHGENLSPQWNTVFLQ